MIDSHGIVLLAIGAFSSEFVVWGEGAFCQVFSGARVLNAKTVDEVIRNGWHVEADIVFLPPVIDELQDLIHEFVRLGKDARQVVFCGKDGQGNAGSLVAAMNAAQPRGAIYMEYGKGAPPVEALKFVRVQIADLFDNASTTLDDTAAK